MKLTKLTVELIGMNMSCSKKWELSLCSGLAGGVSPDNLHVSKKTAIELDENQMEQIKLLFQTQFQQNME